MTGGGWTQAESYRDLIKDKDLAVLLEQQSRMKLTGGSVDHLIAEIYVQPPSRATKCRLGEKAWRVNRREKRRWNRPLPGINTLPI